jgi:hypothetical protein
MVAHHFNRLVRCNPLVNKRHAPLIHTDIFRILSFMSGSQCGTYMIQPQQMNVDWPSNGTSFALGFGPFWSQAHNLSLKA